MSHEPKPYVNLSLAEFDQLTAARQQKELDIAHHESNFEEMRDEVFMEALRFAGHNLCDHNLWKGICRAAASRLSRQLVGLTIADYEEVLADHRRLVREIDVAINGEGAAKQASLCDLVAQIKELVERRCDICGDYHEPGNIPRECETGDGV